MNNISGSFKTIIQEEFSRNLTPQISIQNKDSRNLLNAMEILAEKALSDVPNQNPILSTNPSQNFPLNSNISVHVARKNKNEDDFSVKSNKKQKTDTPEFVKKFIEKHPVEDFINKQKHVFSIKKEVFSEFRKKYDSYKNSEKNPITFKEAWSIIANKLNEWVDNEKVECPLPLQIDPAKAAIDFSRLMNTQGKELVDEKSVITLKEDSNHKAKKDKTEKQIEKAKGKYYLKFNYDHPLFNPLNADKNPLHSTVVIDCRIGNKLGNYINLEHRLDTSIQNWEMPPKRQYLFNAIINCTSKTNKNITQQDFSRKWQHIHGAKSNWRVTNPQAIINILVKFGLPNKNLNILDISAGYGGRPLGIASDIRVSKYVGIDPNQNLFNGYEKLVNLVTNISKVNLNFLCKPAEYLTKADFTKTLKQTEQFDLLMTSPPYGNNETYSKNGLQSSDYFNGKNLQNGLNDWNTKFLQHSLYKAWKLIKEGGFFALNIADYNDKTTTNKSMRQMICIPMIEFLVNELGMEYIGCPGLALGGQKKNVEPIWILKKKIKTDIDKSKFAWKQEIKIKDLFEIKKRYKNSILPDMKYWRELEKYFKQQLKSGKSEINVLSEIENRLGINAETFYREVQNSRKPLALVSSPPIVNPDIEI